MIRALFFYCCIAFISGCGSKISPAPMPRPSASSLISGLRTQSQQIKSYRAESTMDFWTGDERVRATVLVMGEVGSKIRFNALNPDGGSTAADLACDGKIFRYVDYNQNCFLEGPCNRSSVAQLLRIELDPDEFRYFVFGGAPILTARKSALHWNENRRQEFVTVYDEFSNSQTLVLTPAGKSYELAESELKNNDEVIWQLTHKDFKDFEGGVGRVPEKSRFEQKGNNSDLVVRWTKRELNPTLSEKSFSLEIPEGIPECGAAPPTGKAE